MDMKRVLGAAVALSLLSGCGIFKGSGKNKTQVVGERIPILTSESDVDIDATLSDVAVTLPPPVENANWEQPGGNAAKSMGHLALGASPAIAWTARIPGTTGKARLGAAPVVADGRLFVMDTQGMVHAFDAKTGARAWETTIKGEAAGKGGGGFLGLGGSDDGRRAVFGGGVSYGDGKLYATTGLGDVVRMDPASGKIEWQVRPGGPLRGAPSYLAGQLYAISQDNQLYALNANDGATVWTSAGTTEMSGVFGAAAPAIAQGTVVAGFSSGELSAYRYENGRIVWQDALSRTSISTSVSSLSDIDADPVIDGGRVYAVGAGGRMVALELVTGQRLWEINVGGIATPWVAGEWAFVVTSDAKLLCVARTNGKVRWMAQLPRWKNEKKKDNPINWTAPVLAGGRLILASSRGQMVYVAPETGQITATTDIDEAVSLPPLVAGSMLYLLGSKGKITAWR